MLAGIGGWLLSKIIGVASSGLIEKAIDAFGKTAEGKDRTTQEAMKAYVEAQKALEETKRAQMGFPWFWVIVGAFVFFPIVWWNMVFIDSTFNLPGDIQDIPPAFRAQFDLMFQWVFAVGSPVAAIKALWR